MKNDSTVPQARDLFKQIMAEPERMFELVVPRQEKFPELARTCRY